VAHTKQAKELCCQLFWPVLSKVAYLTFTIGRASVKSIQFALPDALGVLLSASDVSNARMRNTLLRFARTLEEAHPCFSLRSLRNGMIRLYVLRISVGQGRTMTTFAGCCEIDAERIICDHMKTMSQPFPSRSLRPSHL
jgi:hypothetical protein